MVGSRAGAVSRRTRLRLCPPFRACRALVSSGRGPVSSPRHLKRSMRISRTTLSCTLGAKGYGAHRVGVAFGVTRTATVLLRDFRTKSWRLRQDGSAFALAYIRRLRSCRLMGEFVISPLPLVLTMESCAAGPLRSAGVTPLHSYYGPIRHPLAFGRFPENGYTAYLSPRISPRGEEGFSSCLAHPCHRAAASTPPERAVASTNMQRPVLPSASRYGLGLRSY